MDNVKAYYFDIPDLLKHGNGVEVHHHMRMENDHVLGVGKITASIYINLEVLKNDNELFVLEADGFEDKPESLMTLISNNQTTLLNAIDRIVETGASVAIAKVDTVVAKVEEVGNGSVKQNHNDDTDAILDHPVADDTSGNYQDLKEKTDTPSKTDVASDLGYDLPPIQCNILGIAKHFKVDDAKGVDINLKSIDGDVVTKEKHEDVKAQIDELVAKTKAVCARTSFIVVDFTEKNSGDYRYCVTIRPTTEDEVKAVDAFYNEMVVLGNVYSDSIFVTPIFNV